MKYIKPLLLMFCLMLFSCTIISCQKSVKQEFIINHNHLNSLYQEIMIDNYEMAIIHIYAEYPDYKWLDDEDEGISCIDDVARAAIYYAEDYRIYANQDSYEKTKKLIDFILYMQSDNSYYYNFIFPDYSINEEHQNSINQPGWWSWRALWALLETYDVIEEEDTITSEEMKKQIIAVVEGIKNEIEINDEKFEFAGITLPSWLPHQTASDQAALLVIALSKYVDLFNDKSVIPIIENLSDGIALMQIKDNSFKYDGAILSWQNVWHGWGNSQSTALLSAYEITKEKRFLETALYEIDNFFTRVKKNNGVNEFRVIKEDKKYKLEEDIQFSQIAYGIRPMVFASLKAFEITGEKKYAVLAGEIASWFYGNNISGYKMYYDKTGICYDGIISETEVNKNSGAESTIEALLSLQKIIQNKISLKSLKNSIDNE